MSSHRLYWITNLKTKTYIPVTPTDESFDGDWTKNYPHTKGANWSDIQAFSLWDPDRTSNGIYFTYDLCVDGGLFQLLVDTETHSPEEVEKAKTELRYKQDVVFLTVHHLTRYNNQEPETCLDPNFSQHPKRWG